MRLNDEHLCCCRENPTAHPPFVGQKKNRPPPASSNHPLVTRRNVIPQGSEKNQGGVRRIRRRSSPGGKRATRPTSRIENSDCAGTCMLNTLNECCVSRHLFGARFWIQNEKKRVLLTWTQAIATYNVDGWGRRLFQPSTNRETFGGRPLQKTAARSGPSWKVVNEAGARGKFPAASSDFKIAPAPLSISVNQGSFQEAIKRSLVTGMGVFPRCFFNQG